MSIAFRILEVLLKITKPVLYIVNRPNANGTTPKRGRRYIWHCVRRCNGCRFWDQTVWPNAFPASQNKAAIPVHQPAHRFQDKTFAELGHHRPLGQAANEF